MYKIFGFANFSFALAYSPSVQDWSAFYTQLTPEHSMRYLTKKWSDGADSACLLRLTIKPNSFKPLKLIKVSHSNLSKATVSGEAKAQLIKRHLH